MSTAEDVAEALGCEVSIVAEYAADVARELETLRREVHGLRAEVLTLHQERGEGEWQARRCECGADDACAFARERDAATAERDKLKEAVRSLLTANGCDCPCDCPPDHRGPDCGELCLACRIEKAVKP